VFALLVTAGCVHCQECLVDVDKQAVVSEALLQVKALSATVSVHSASHASDNDPTGLFSAAASSAGNSAAQTATSVAQAAAKPTSAKIAPFGKEDTARALQSHAASTQDTLVDAVENAEVAEIKRAVFRALTRLRAAEIKEFDTIARLETQAIDEYNDNHHYRKENPLSYIHSEEPRVALDKYRSFHD